MSGASHRQKGNRIEREIVDHHREKRMGRRGFSDGSRV
jgi:hypothetical protein